MAVRPLPLEPTRVHRFYRGGALLGRLRGEAEEDAFFPEDWLGSVTPARNPGRNDPAEGSSRLADGRTLRDAVEADPIRWLGETHVARFGTSTGLLAKLLDTAQRLPGAFPPRSRLRARCLRVAVREDRGIDRAGQQYVGVFSCRIYWLAGRLRIAVDGGCSQGH